MSACPDCGAAIDQPHVRGCDVERCPECGRQRLGCGCKTKRPPLPWSGEWPGVLEARAFGFWCTEPTLGAGFRRVPAGTPGAVEDLTRVMVACVWDPDARQWVQR